MCFSLGAKAQSTLLVEMTDEHRSSSCRLTSVVPCTNGSVHAWAAYLSA